MIVAGIDVGGKNVHIVIKNDGKVLGKGTCHTGIKKAEAVETLYDQVLKKVNLSRKDIERVVATGSGAKRAAFADGFILDAAADARGVSKLIPSARTVIDVGAEQGRAIKVSAEGKVMDFAINEKCAAGTGTFVEAMARALQVSMDEMAEIALGSTQTLSTNAQCAVFGESEVVSLIHQKTPKPDIVRAVMNAIAGRVGSVARIVGLEKDVVLVGGMARNAAFVDSLKKNIEMDVIVPQDPDYMGAFGAAEAALTRVVTSEVRVLEKPSSKTHPFEGKASMELGYQAKEERSAQEVKQEFWRWPETNWVNPDIDWKKGEWVTAGVDVGSVSTQAVIMVDGEFFAYGNTRTGSDSPDSARNGMAFALAKTDLRIENMDYCIGTGYGRVNVPMAQQSITEISCHAKGANFMYGPEVRTVMDMGGQDCKAINVDDRGRVLSFIMNDKCAAGTGRGMEVFADLIRVPVWEIGPRSFRIAKEPPMISSNCVIFAKSEVVGLLEAGMPENEIMAAYCSAMAHRIMELLNRLEIKEKFVITGGIAKNEGVVKRLENELGIKTADRTWNKKEYVDCGYPFDTQLAGAIGAALFGNAFLKMGKVKSARKA